MRLHKTLCLKASWVALLFASGMVRASTDLESRLEELRLPDNVAPAGISEEKLYSVQNRHASLDKRHELSLGGTHNFTGSSFLSSNQIDLNYRFHFNSRWHLSVGGSYGSNALTESARALFQKDGILPDVAYVKYRANAMVGYHLFYGKFRLGMDEVLYFDQYVSAGPGLVVTQYQSAVAAVVDIGMVFWLGRNASFRFGFKNDFFNEQRATESGFRHHLLGHFDVGYAFGDGRPK